MSQTWAPTRPVRAFPSASRRNRSRGGVGGALSSTPCLRRCPHGPHERRQGRLFGVSVDLGLQAAATSPKRQAGKPAFRGCSTPAAALAQPAAAALILVPWIPSLSGWALGPRSRRGWAGRARRKPTGWGRSGSRPAPAEGHLGRPAHPPGRAIAGPSSPGEAGPARFGRPPPHPLPPHSSGAGSLSSHRPCDLRAAEPPQPPKPGERTASGAN